MTARLAWLLACLALPTLVAVSPIAASTHDPDCREIWLAPGMGYVVCTDAHDPECTVYVAIVRPPAEWEEHCLPRDLP